MRRYATIIATLFILSLTGCHSYIQRTVWQSFSRLCDTIPSPPHLITTPILPGAKLAVSWAGHSTVIIQIHDRIIITDPLFTNTIGLFVKRYVKAGLDPAIIAKVDCILISHIHLDHLSYGSLNVLPKNGILLTPYGSAAYIPDFDFENIYEMKPWEIVETDSIHIAAVPVQHFTGRYGFDSKWLGETGYAGYIVEYRGIVIFFAGDTGYNSELCKEIGRRYNIDLAIIPIAPSSSMGLGGRVHVSPAGALAIFKDVGAKYMVPVHYGAFLYGSTANPDAPREWIQAEAQAQGISDMIISLEVGEQRIIF